MSFQAVTRSNLAGLAEQWDDECYALVRLATYEDHVRVEEANASHKGREGLEFQREFVREMYVSGKAKAFKDGEFVLIDLTAADAASIPSVCDKLYMDIMGIDLDPKALASLKMEAVRAEMQSSDNEPTETRSSEESPTSEPTSNGN